MGNNPIETKYDTPTVRSEIIGTTGERNTMINTTRMKMIEITSVFSLPLEKM